MSYPEHDKLRAVKSKSQACGDFLKWLQDYKGYELAARHEHNEECDRGRRGCQLADSLEAVHVRVETLLATYFEIDLKKLEEEKLAMLEALRRARAP